MFHMELAQFDQAAGETIPEKVRLVRGRHWHNPQHELWAASAERTLRLPLFPHLECRIVELWPLLFFNRTNRVVDEQLCIDLGYSRVNRFFLVVDRKLGKCRFGPAQGRMALDRAWRSFGLGSYLLSRLIAWGTEHYPTCAVTTEHFELSSVDVERPSLNGFCRRAGFDVIFHAPDGVTCCIKRLELLQPEYNRERVAEIQQVAPTEWFSPTFLGSAAAGLARSCCLEYVPGMS